MTEKEAWQYYKTWMNEKTFSKALNSEIKITRMGWEHLTRGTKNNRRSKLDTHQRLSLLQIAKKIVKEVTEYTLEKREGATYYVLPRKAKLKINGRHKDKLVKVIIKLNSKREKVLYSVMRKK